MVLFLVLPCFFVPIANAICCKYTLVLIIFALCLLFDNLCVYVILTEVYSCDGRQTVSAVPNESATALTAVRA